MASAVAGALAREPSFRIGSKQIFLPTATLTLLRTNLGANYAKFRVPLNFSKLDLRDYLWHAYGVEIVSARSYVKQQRVQQGTGKDIKPAPRRWHRPQAHKHMTVELARPFVWPEEPKDYKDWNMEEVMDSEKEGEAFQELSGPMRDTVVNEDRRKKMREQAKALLSGKAAWTPPVGGQSVSMLSRRG